MIPEGRSSQGIVGLVTPPQPSAFLFSFPPICPSKKFVISICSEDEIDLLFAATALFRRIFHGRSGNLSGTAHARTTICGTTPQPRAFSNLGEVNLCVD